MGKLLLLQNGSLQECPSAHKARVPVSATPPSFPKGRRMHTHRHTQTQSWRTEAQSLKRTPGPPWVSTPGPSDSLLLLPAWLQHLFSHRVDLQAVAVPVAPMVLLGAAKEKVLGQSLSKAECSLVLPGVLGLLKCRLDQGMTWAPGVGDVFQLCLQCLEAVLGAWGHERRWRMRLNYWKRNVIVHKMPISDHIQNQQ